MRTQIDKSSNWTSAQTFWHVTKYLHLPSTSLNIIQVIKSKVFQLTSKKNPNFAFSDFILFRIMILQAKLWTTHGGEYIASSSFILLTLSILKWNTNLNGFSPGSTQVILIMVSINRVSYEISTENILNKNFLGKITNP